MRLVYLDLETYWHKTNFTLSKMGTEAYIRHSSFHTLLLAAAIDDGPVYVFEEEDIAAVLGGLGLDDPDTLTISVNASFDHSVLEYRYGIRIANSICTRALCRWTGVSRLTAESLHSMNQFFGWGVKKAGTVVSSGKLREDFTPEEWAFFKQYNRDDVEQMRHHVKLMLPLVPHHALMFDAMSERMYTRPLLEIDAELLRDYERRLIQKQEDDMHRLQRLFSFSDRNEFVKAIRSRVKFPEMLRSLGVEPPLKTSEARVKSVGDSIEELDRILKELGGQRANAETKKAIAKHIKNIRKGTTTYALAKDDLDFMALMDSEDEDVALLCRVRAEVNSSIALSRCQTLLAIAERGAFPVTLAAFQAITGRYTGSNADDSTKSDATNPQNFNKRSGDHTLRRALRAPAGYKIVAADSGQVELRVNAFVWGEDWLLEILNDDSRDTYCEFASQAYGFTVTKTDKKERGVGKTCELQLGYQSGWRKLARKLKQERVDISTPTATHDEECERLVSVYRKTHVAIKRGWQICMDVVKEMAAGKSGYFGGPNHNLFYFNGQDNIFGTPCATVTLPDGFKLYYPNLRYDPDTDEYLYDQYDRQKRRIVTRKLYGGKLCNNVIQGLTAAIIRWQMLEIDDPQNLPIVMQVHDEIVVLCRAGDEERVLEFMLSVMKTSPPWMPPGCPFRASGGYGDTYADVG